MAGEANLNKGGRSRPDFWRQFWSELLATFLAAALGLLAGVLIDNGIQKPALRAGSSSKSTVSVQTAQSYAEAKHGAFDWMQHEKKRGEP
jgi:hypothetical protein